MTTQAGLRSVRVFQALVEFLEQGPIVRLQIRRAGVMTGGAGNHDWLALRILFS